MTSGPVLVTGAAGFIGRRLVQVLRERGADVFSWTRTQGDLTDPASVSRIMRDVSPALIYHLAAGPAAQASDSWAVAAAEVAMLANLAGAMPIDARLVHCGSMAEYGRSGTFAENDLRQPRSLYGFAKAASVDHAITLAATSGLDIRVTRLFGVYGMGEADSRLIPHLVRHLVAGQTVPLRSGGQIRDFIHVDDVCHCLIAIAELHASTPTLINVGTGVGVSVAQVAVRVADLLCVDTALLDFGTLPARAIDEGSLIARVDRLGQIIPVPGQHWLTDDGPAAQYVLELADRPSVRSEAAAR